MTKALVDQTNTIGVVRKFFDEKLEAHNEEYERFLAEDRSLMEETSFLSPEEFQHKRDRLQKWEEELKRKSASIQKEFEQRDQILLELQAHMTTLHIQLDELFKEQITGLNEHKEALVAFSKELTTGYNQYLIMASQERRGMFKELVDGLKDIVVALRPQLQAEQPREVVQEGAKEAGPKNVEASSLSQSQSPHNFHNENRKRKRKREEDARASSSPESDVSPLKSENAIKRPQN